MGGRIYLATNRFLLRGHHRLIVHVTPGHTLIRKGPGLLTLSHLNQEKKSSAGLLFSPLLDRVAQGRFLPIGEVFAHNLAGIFFSPS